VLRESLGVFECERYGIHDGGDHQILVGRVVKASFDPNLDPLLFFRGRYRRLHFD
jgi:flavin reductase (DIM6/NTAB) family NADH-FMN oxidoreductase RutF